jgi:gamma-glutamyltranspeptidase
LASLEKVGANGFYNGTLARQIVDEVNKAGGVLSLNDLSEYRYVEEKCSLKQGIRVSNYLPEIL